MIIVTMTEASKWHFAYWLLSLVSLQVNECIWFEIFAFECFIYFFSFLDICVCCCGFFYMPYKLFDNKSSQAFVYVCICIDGTQWTKWKKKEKERNVLSKQLLLSLFFIKFILVTVKINQTFFVVVLTRSFTLPFNESTIIFGCRICCLL